MLKGEEAAGPGGPAMGRGATGPSPGLWHKEPGLAGECWHEGLKQGGGAAGSLKGLNEARGSSLGTRLVWVEWGSNRK